MAYKRLYRSEKDRMLAGVCGGLGEYLDVDPVIIRLVFVVMVMVGGGGLLAYIIMWLIVPTESTVKATKQTDVVESNVREMKDTAKKVVKSVEKVVKEKE